MTYLDSKLDVRQLLRELGTATTDLEMGLDENLEPDDDQTLVMAETRNMLLLVSQTHQNSLRWLATRFDNATDHGPVEPMPLSSVPLSLGDTGNLSPPPPPRLTMARRCLNLCRLPAGVVVPIAVLVAAVFVSADSFLATDQPPPMVQTDLAGWLVRVPAGTTNLGTSAADRADVILTCDLNDANRARIALELASRQQVGSFYMGRTEVTVGQWRQFATASGHLTHAELSRGMGRIGRRWVREHGFGWDDLGDMLLDDLLPVANVTQADAAAYCRWLSSETGHTYRLPTDAEWEHAARAGTTTRWASGDDLVDACRMGWNARNAKGLPHPVGQLPPNAWGLHDMSGGVSEWTSGRWAGKESWVVNRGGSFRGSAWLARPASRAGVNASFVSAATGFRVVREIDPATDIAGR